MSSDLIQAIRAHSRLSISKAISLIENKRDAGSKLLSNLFQYTGHAYRIGITGPPGSGKSSLINMLIPILRDNKLSVGVIAIDPSSPITGGSFLGDRVRIKNAIDDKHVFVRSMGSRAELGGITELAEDFSDILAFSGKDIVFIETVGVGQSEYSVSEITDLTALVLVPESGDEIQLLKAGILELADIFVVNKYDREDANLMVRSIKNIIPSTKKGGTQISIFRTSCKTGDGIEDFANALIKFYSSINKNKNVKPRQMLRLSRRVKNIIENDIVEGFWTEKRKKFLKKMNTKDTKLESPYDMVDKIKDL